MGVEPGLKGEGDVPVTVAVPTHGRPDLLERTLESLTQCELPEGYQELVVIENGSRAGAETLVNELPDRLNARYMHRERGNKSHALNEALETIEDGLVVFFDDDVKVHLDTLVAYAEAAKDHGPEHFFGGPVDVDRDKPLPESLEHLFPRSVRGYDLENSRMGDKYLGFNWAAFTTDLKGVGGFNTNLGPGTDTPTDVGDESELQERLIEAECQGVDVRRAWVSHFVPSEHTTFRWLLRRRIQGGVRTGLESEAPWWQFAATMMWQTVISCAVAAKGLITVNKEKLAFLIGNLFQRVGIIKGYVWNKLKESN